MRATKAEVTPAPTTFGPQKLQVNFTVLRDSFSKLEDPRVNRSKVYSLFDIIGFTLISTICGADNWVAIQRFGENKIDWLSKFISLEHGIPSHDTISRVFSLINVDEFTCCLVSWLKLISIDGKLLNIDGKALKGSRSVAGDMKALHVVTAWLSEAGISVGHIACDEKSNEITAIPDLLELIDVTGRIVTIDAMGCQKKIAQKIVDKGGDYVLGLKGNQGKLHESIKLSFVGASTELLVQRADAVYSSVDKDHGRLEERTVCTFYDAGQWPETSDWQGLNSIIVTNRKRTILATGDVSCEQQYYISSLSKPLGHEVAQAVRGHWSVENALHWQLDVTFREDKCQTVDRHSAQNLSSVRKAALTLLERTKSRHKCGVQTLRSIAGWNSKVAEEILSKADCLTTS